MKTKRFGTPFLAALVLSAFVLGAGFHSAAEGVYKTVEALMMDLVITVNGREIHPQEADGTPLVPLVYKNRTYLPLRALGEALGKTVTWDGDSSTISITEPVTEPEEITVSTAAELVAAFGSNRRITLKEGVYNLSALEGQYIGGGNVSWREVYDGSELVLSDIHNMELIGGGKAEIVVSPRYSYVLGFENCGNIAISGVTAGHTKGGECVGGVFAFDACAKISLENTKMYGCGTEGLCISNTSDFKAVSCEIYECTYDIMVVSDSKDISFDNCLFRDNRGFWMVSADDTSGFTMTGCQFLRNRCTDPFFMIFSCENVKVENNTFRDNTASAFETGGMIKRENNTFSNNSFDSAAKK